MTLTVRETGPGVRQAAEPTTAAKPSWGRLRLSEACADCHCKISARVETFGRLEMEGYAGWCGRALALSHARSRSSEMLSGYMGKSDVFDKAVAEFAVAYADQNEKDHAAFARAVKKGTVEAVFEEDR